MLKTPHRWLVRCALVVLAVAAVTGWAWHRARFLRAASAAFEGKSWYKAIAQAQAHLAFQPDDDAARRILALSLARTGQWAESAAAFATIADPTADDLRARGDALVRQAQWFDAAYVYEELLQTLPDDPYSLQQLAVLRAKQGRELEGIALAERLAKQPGHEARGFAMLAALHQNRANLVGAIECWRRVIELDPESGTLPGSIPPEKVRLDLADCLLRLGRWEEALEPLEFVEQRWPDEPQVLLLLGWCWLYRGEDLRAQQLWEQVLQRAPDSADALTKLGELKLQRGLAHDALELLQRAIAVRPDDPGSHAVLANVYRQIGDTELSRQHSARSQVLRQRLEDREKSDRFLKLDPSAKSGKLVKGLQLARDGKWQEAEQWVREVLREDSGDVAAQQLLQDILTRRVAPEPVDP